MIYDFHLEIVYTVHQSNQGDSHMFAIAIAAYAGFTIAGTSAGIKERTAPPIP